MKTETCAECFWRGLERAARTRSTHMGTLKLISCVLLLAILIVLQILFVQRWSAGYSQQTARQTPTNHASAQKKKMYGCHSKRPSTSIVMYRILGNDIPGRHHVGQTWKNLVYMLQHEEAFKNCEKRFVLNRILNATLENHIMAMLEQKGMRYSRIEFKASEYRQIPHETWCFPDPLYFLSDGYYNLSNTDRLRARLQLFYRKNLYIMNNNGARNVALEKGKQDAEWTLPWDGNCFLESSGWDDLYQTLLSTEAKYVTVPMVRLTTYPNVHPRILRKVNATEEPQIAFHASSEQIFDESYPYGHIPKAELLQRLQSPGRWLSWGGDARKLGLSCPRQTTAIDRDANARRDVNAGWVSRLPSGHASLEVGEGASIERWRARAEGTIKFLMDVDLHLQQRTFSDPVFYDLSVLQQQLLAFQRGTPVLLQRILRLLLSEANKAVNRGPFSVMYKKLVAPSGDQHDYFHVPPYYWPQVNEKNETYFVRKDGQRHPAAVLYSLESAAYDRSSLQRMFVDTTICALAWFFTGNRTFADHGALLLKTFFVRAGTRMNPHLQYAQYTNRASSSGIIEMKDLYYFLDAARLLERSKALDKKNASHFKSWLRKYQKWLLKSELGRKEMVAANNHGIYFDLQTASIAAYLEERTSLLEAIARAQTRIPFHFTPKGEQPEELVRPTSRHYTNFNLLGWVHMAVLAHKFGAPIWQVKNFEGSSIQKAVQLHFKQALNWPYPDRGSFDVERFEVLRWLVRIPDFSNTETYAEEEMYSIKPNLHPHDGVQPFWNLGLSFKNLPR